jgi:hypothetical protein
MSEHAFPFAKSDDASGISESGERASQKTQLPRLDSNQQPFG